MAAGPRRFAYVTLLTRNSYLPGLLVLWFSLREAGARYPLVVMVTPSLPFDDRNLLHKAGIRMIEVEALQPPVESKPVASDSRFADTWTKLRGFDLVEFERIVLLDCDMVVRRNIDDLFALSLPHDEIAAVHVCACNPYKLEHYPKDWIPKNCAHSAVPTPKSPPPKVTDSPRPYQQLNSGTLVIQPSHELFQTISRVLRDEDVVSKFTFPDQDLLTVAFHDKWMPLPWYYNAMRTLPNTHPQLWDEEVVRCVHYILADKPWMSRKPQMQEWAKMHEWWWHTFDRMLSALEEVSPEGARWLAVQVDRDSGNV